MSTGVSYFEQLAWDLDQRGVSDIDIPVLVLGIAQSPSRNPSSYTYQVGLWDEP